MKKTKRIVLPKIVRIEVRGGVAEVVTKPKGVHVKIIDHDDQGGSGGASCHYHESVVIRNGGRLK